ncbi:NADPH-dependent FMN reductase [Halalkalibacter kiskunsagensis]|uniref:NADPH-dependent FMN reductase n=1 Tax=Halalkalibacter kiskunsagensis TaxID=1548599 RepID=A0ABV6KH84_9BACI
MSNIIIISGSPSKTSRLNGVIHYAQSHLQNKGVKVETLEVIDLPAEDLIYARFDSEPVQKAIKKVEEADAIIVASQVYKASFTGVLKTFLDLLPQKSLVDKVVLPLVLAGTLAHFLTIEYSFKPVLSALGSTNISNGVYALETGVKRNEEGVVQFDEETKKRVDRALEGFLIEVNYHSLRYEQVTSERIN